ncbi:MULTISPECIES: alpha/beta fold hydrolase [unclassified Streptomyces]|uniref:alpha/beta fold hydrolase n=1 Tax=unclassified Streptomyces TaxID=2593676 RepID=UPI00048AAF4E|nr:MULTISPECIES: alpha/beta hydrolase [unclassified Streptomyces]MYY18060.1 alpha/beta fold hydrolase [Streptomyces sp. SID4912]SCD39913.1 Pimeloyl-ACP methyl ester carboxylesterase [Streptomyces sp. DpondAA-D4]
MPPSVIRPSRLAGRLLAATAAVVGLVALFLVLIVATDGAGSGSAAWSATAGVGVVAAVWRGRRRSCRGRLVPFLPVLVATALTLSVCVPTVPTTRHHPPALSFVATEHMRLSTGSRVAVYHYPPTGNGPRQRTPLVYLNGGPVRGISVLDHRFLQRLAGQGYDVYAYEQAGGGRSDLLPMNQYSITRSVHDLGAFVDELGVGRADVLGFSSGAVVLTRALADPTVADHLRRAVIAEPGPMDGPTARMAGQKGRPSARGIAPAMTGPRSTRVPRYAVAFGLMRLGLLSPDNGLVGQAEGDNAFTAADLGSDTASAYCARDAHRIPVEDTAENFSFSAAASLRVQRTIQDSPSVTPQLRRSRTPAMLMIAECSSQIRQWQTTLLADNPAVQRTQYMPGVGHHMWNGLGDNDQRAAAVITAFLQDKPAPLPDYPTRADIPAFLRDHK